MKTIILECMWCGSEFEREAKKERHIRHQGKNGPFCSTYCSGKWTHFYKVSTSPISVH